MGLRKLLLSLGCALACFAAGAQTVNLTAWNTKTLSGKTFTGKLCIVPTNNSGAVINFQYGLGGQGTTNQVCFQVTAGVLQSGVTVPDTYLTNPQNLCLNAQLIDPTQSPQWPSKSVVGTFPCLQPASSGQSWCSTTGGVTTCDLDNYAPVAQGLIVQQTGIQGPIGPPGANGGLPGAVDMSTLIGADFGANLTVCLAAINSTYGGICEGRGLGTTAQSIASPVTISTPNTVINLPCATITTAQQIVVAPGVRNVTIHGCAFEGGSNANGTAGGTVLVYTGNGAAIQVGDTTYAQNTMGFHIDNVNLNTASAGTSATGLAFYRTQEIDARNLYLNGNQLASQTGIYLDGTGNYTGGSFDSDTLNGFGAGVYMTGHLSGSVAGDFTNASTFTRLHIVCPTSGGNPISGTYGVNVVAGDGNTWNGGDVENCSTMFHLGANAVNNTILGLRNEQSTIQYQADSGSSFNAVFTGGTFFTGALIDNGSRNSFWDAFHRTVNGVKGDWYASQADVSITDHERLGTGTGNERGRETEIQTDYGYRWIHGFTDATAGEQFWHVKDLLNNLDRFNAGQMNNGQSSTNNQTVINSAGTGGIVINGSTNAGTGGVIVNSGGATPAEIYFIDNAGNVSAWGQLNFYSGSTETWQWECQSLTTCQLRNANATTPMSPFIAYTNGGTEIDSQAATAVVVNNHATAGTGGFIVYEGGANYNTAAFSVSSAGNATMTNNAVVGNHLNQAATKDFSGTCAMTSGTTCTVAMNHSWTSTPDCHANPIGSTPYYASYSVSSNNVTLTANTSNSATWSVTCIGNPN
jgi:hypothetical protein